MDIVVIIVLIVIVLISVVIFYASAHATLFPINSLLQLDFSPRAAIFSNADTISYFPISASLEEKWKEILAEGISMHETIGGGNYLDNYNLNLNEADTNKWETIPLRLFGRDVDKNIKQCPILGEIVKNNSSIVSCMYSIIEAGKIIKPHKGPYDGLLRYQLGLEIPEGECYLHVNGEVYYWTAGKGVIFDEVYEHGVVNNTKYRRIVLLIDIKRTYNSFVFNFINDVIVKIMGAIPSTKKAVENA